MKFTMDRTFENRDLPLHIPPVPPPPLCSLESDCVLSRLLAATTDAACDASDPLFPATCLGEINAPIRPAETERARERARERERERKRERKKEREREHFIYCKANR